MTMSTNKVLKEQEQSETAFLRRGESDRDPESVSGSILRIRTRDPDL